MTYKSIILILIALMPIPLVVAPYSYLLHIALAVIFFLILRNKEITSKNLQIISLVLFILFLIFGNVVGLIFGKVSSYIMTGTSSDGLHFYGVAQTVAEAGKIPFFPASNGGSNVAQRLSGSSLGFLLSIVGYILLVMKRKEFILALPLIGIAIFAHWGGLRFTVYAVPVAALSATYALFALAGQKDKKILVYGAIGLVLLALIQNYDLHHTGLDGLISGAKHLFSFNMIEAETKIYEQLAYIALLILFVSWAIMYKKSGKAKSELIYAVLLSTIILLPNITHVTRYNPGTVMNKTEVQDLDKLNKIASAKDYTLSWWDYGYPIWYYSDTSTLIDGGKHNEDNFIISKILQTDSSALAAGLSRVAVEKYAETNKTVATQIFDENNDTKNPNMLLRALRKSTYEIPQKTRDIYLYLTNKMIRIFPTITSFGNLNLKTGKELRQPFFYNGRSSYNVGSRVILTKNISYDLSKGVLHYGQDTLKLKYFIETLNDRNGKVIKKTKHYNVNGRFSVIYAKSLGRHLIMDNKTLNSMFIQMLLLGDYDKSKFELVVSSKHSKIYKLKQ